MRHVNHILSQPKAQPKSAASNKHSAGAAKGNAAKGKGNKPARARNARPAKKTAEELDSEMADYFVANSNADSNANAAPAAAPAPVATGDAPMEDEIMVSNSKRGVCEFKLTVDLVREFDLG